MMTFLKEERGATATEYSLIGVLILVTAAAALDRMAASLDHQIYAVILGVEGHF